MGRWVRIEAEWEYWKPEVGAVLEGKYAGIVTLRGEHGSFESAGVVCDDGSRVSVSQRGAVELISTSALSIGDRIRLAFVREKPTRAGHSVHVFSLSVWKE